MLREQRGYRRRKQGRNRMIQGNGRSGRISLELSVVRSLDVRRLALAVERHDQRQPTDTSAAATVMT